MTKKLGLVLGMGLAAALGLPMAGCLGAAFTETGSGGTSSTSTGSGGSAGSTTSNTTTSSTTTSSTSTSSTSATITCTGGKTACGDQCANLANSEQHCGACSHACAAGNSCVGGNCICKGTVTQVECNGTCPDLQIDPNNCGSCGHKCVGGHTCGAGACVCPPGTQVCGTSCIDTAHDPLNCGTCGHKCGATEKCVPGDANPLPTSASCIAGDCPGNAKNCSGGCYSPEQLASDINNCGDCGKQCGPGQVCAAGNCHPFTVPVVCGSTNCSSGNRCCSVPGSIVNICVEGDTCPWAN